MRLRSSRVLEPIQLDVIEIGAPLSVKVNGNNVKYVDLLQEEIRSKPDGYWSTQVDIRNVNYNVYE